MRRLFILGLVILLSSAQFTFSQVITTVAGSDWTFPGDGRPATNAPLGAIYGVAADSAGNVFAIDAFNKLLVKVSGNGVLNVVAGNGLHGFSGDGGPATNASLRPYSLAVDGQGNIYIADVDNNRVRKVSPAGIITTVAGNGVAGFSGDGGPAISASLNSPLGVAADGAGNLYISDGFNQRIRKVSPDGMIRTIAGTGAVGFSGDGGPATNATFRRASGVALDTTGNLYIADSFGHRVRKVSAGGTISTVAGNGILGFSGDGGPATSARLWQPEGVALDTAGNLYIADTNNNRIRKVSPGGTITTIAGTGIADLSGDGGAATSASLNRPFGVTIDGTGNIYVADRSNFRIRKINSGGTVTTLAGNGLFEFSGDGGPATSAALSQPLGIAVNAAGNFYLADSLSNHIRKIDAGGVITSVAGTGVRGFSGDSGPATNAALAFPVDVALDQTGNLYVADALNHRIRKISPAGIITTVAGDGFIQACVGFVALARLCGRFFGDGGPATTASLEFPQGVAVDGAGNLYIADTGNNRIRKVSPAGVITTAAGDGFTQACGFNVFRPCGRFSGDGGPATSASLDYPVRVTVDGSGNLYIADNGNHRIRKVNAAGIITTAAGDGFINPADGSGRFSGDGGPAALASLNGPFGVTVDPAGNLYLADSDNHRIRKVSLAGIINTVAGNGQDQFAGDGGLPTSASFPSPAAVALDNVGNLYIVDSGSNRVQKVLATAPSFAVAPAKLSFSAVSGAPAVAPQQIAVSSPVVGLAWSAQSSASWLRASPASGSCPGTVSMTVDVSALAPATYQGILTVLATLASPSTQTVSIDLTVAPSLPPQLAVQPSSLIFEIPSGTGNPPAQTLRISNAGAGTLNWTAQAQTADGRNWLSVSAASGPVPASLQVSVNSSGLLPGTYSGTVQVNSPTTNENKTIAVTFLVTQVTRTILLSQSGLTFTGVEGGGIVPSQTFGVLNIGQGTMSWTATASTGSWLTVLPDSGSSTALSPDVPLVEVSPNVAGLSAGQYSGQIRVDAPGATNTPQFVTLILNVLPRGTNPPPLVRPTGLIFVRQAGTSSPGSQNVRVATAASVALEAVSNPGTFNGGSWLAAVPGRLTFSPTQPGSIIIQPNLGSLTPGEYFGALTLLFGDRSSQNVNVLFVVTPGGGSAAANQGDFGGEAAACVPQRLYLAIRTLASNFVSSAGYPNTIQAQVMDDCASPVPNATAMASFSPSGDTPVSLRSLGNGLYEGTWRPSSLSTRIVTVRAELASLAPAQVQTPVQVTGNTDFSAVNPGGIVNAASFAGGALAPGSIVSVFGSNMSSATSGVTGFPLPTKLGGATLNVGGQEVPLYYSSAGQLNAQLPFELPLNFRPQAYVKVSRAGQDSLTVPETITIAGAGPGIFTVNPQGQGVVLDVQGRLVDSTAPAVAGDVVVIYATGLGPVDRPVQTGRPAPADPPAKVTIPVDARIGGQPAIVQFAGLTPGFAGLYQVNVQIPAGVTAGAAVPLVLLQNGVPSNTVTLAVK